MRTVITGITGFVGGHLAEHLLAEEDHVIGCARRGRWPADLEHLRERVRLAACDLNDEACLRGLFASESVDVVFHLAGLASPRACAADPGRAERENVEATRKLYDAVRSSGQRPRVVFVSSSYVYGRPLPNELPLTTSAPIRADHPYAASKWAAEQLSVRYAEEYGLDVARVRPFNHTGPRQPLGYIVSDWASQLAQFDRAAGANAAHDRAVLRVGNLDSRRDYTDVRDVVRGYRLLALRAAAGSVYNLGSGVAVSGSEILDVLCRLCRVPVACEIDPRLVRSDEAPEIRADASELERLTGWRPRIAFETTLRDTFEYWKARQGTTS
jgi:GDP-4-dehydro-6-deoxy-D-mannose reductase